MINNYQLIIGKIKSLYSNEYRDYLCYEQKKLHNPVQKLQQITD